MGALAAFRRGILTALRHPQAWFMAYLGNLLTALWLALLPALALLVPAHLTALRQAADGIDAWQVLEFFTSSQTVGLLQPGADASPWLTTGALWALSLIVVLPLAAGWPAAFLSGGILLAYHEDPFGWRRFFWGCWHWWGPFLLLDALQGIFGLVIFGALLWGTIWLAGMAGAWLYWLTLPGIGLALGLWWLWGESTRLLAVVHGRRDVFWALGQAARLFFRRPGSLLGLYVLGVLALVALHVFFRLGVMPLLPLAWWPLVFLVTQAFILLRLGARLARWAGLAALAKGQNP